MIYVDGKKPTVTMSPAERYRDFSHETPPDDVYHEPSPSSGNASDRVLIYSPPSVPGRSAVARSSRAGTIIGHDFPPPPPPRLYARVLKINPRRQTSDGGAVFVISSLDDPSPTTT